MLLGVLAAPPLAAQAPLHIAGRVVRVRGADTLPAAGVALTLHRIGRTAQGAVDSGTSAIDGGFRFRQRADTTALYLVSARYAGIEYFGEPLRAPGSDGTLVLVSDTSSTAPLSLGARHVMIRRPDDSGARAVLDLFSIQNDGPDTRVSVGGDTPTWSLLLPPGAADPEVEQGELSSAAIQFRGDTLFLLAPVSPGRKNVMIAYTLPPGVDRPRWTAPTDTFDVLVEEPGATVRGAGLAPADSVMMASTVLRRWTALKPDGPWAEVRFGGGATARRGVLALLIGLLAVAVVGGGALAFRRRGQPQPQRAPVTPPDLIDALARLDAAFAGRRDAVSAAEWEAYRQERTRLKAAAEAATLARRRSRP